MNSKKIIRAKDVMKDNYIEVDGMMTVKDAIHALRHSDASVIMIKKRHADDAHGLVLLADIAKQVLANDRSPERVNVYEIMAKPVISMPPEMDVRYCARLFNQFGLSVAPVIENDTVIGIVSYGELVLQGLFALHDD